MAGDLREPPEGPSGLEPPDALKADERAALARALSRAPLPETLPEAEAHALEVSVWWDDALIDTAQIVELRDVSFGGSGDRADVHADVELPLGRSPLASHGIAHWRRVGRAIAARSNRS